MNPLTYIPAEVRQYVYIGYSVALVIIGATQAGFAAAAVDQPVWLTVTLAVFAYLGIALGFTAASNVQGSTDPAATEGTAGLDESDAL